MNKVQEKISQTIKNTKLLVPMTLIALISILNSGCTKSPTQWREKSQKDIQEYMEEDLNENFILVDSGTYYYSGQGKAISGKEAAAAISQFKSHHPELKIVNVIKDEHVNGEMIILVETRKFYSIDTIKKQ